MKHLAAQKIDENKEGGGISHWKEAETQQVANFWSGKPRLASSPSRQPQRSRYNTDGRRLHTFNPSTDTQHADGQLTFQREDPLSQRVRDVLQRRLVRHIEEVLLIRVAGDELDFLQKGFGVDSSTVVITQNLDKTQSKALRTEFLKSKTTEEEV